MNKCKVWTVINKNDVPKSRKLIGTRLIFKEKRDVTYRARLVALGYSQVLGEDFMENFSPVVKHSSFRLVLILLQKMGLKLGV